MKKVLFLAVALSAMCVLGALPVAHAQEDEGWPEEEQPGAWVLTKLEGKGTFTSQNCFWDEDLTGHKDHAWEYLYANSNPSPDGSLSVGYQVWATVPEEAYGKDPGGGAVVAVSGKFKVWMEWQGSGTPTKVCYLRLTPVASASAGGMHGVPGPWSIEADNGTPPPASLSGDATDPTSGYGGSAIAYDASKPNRFIKIDTGSQRQINGKEIDVTLSASGVISTSNWGSAGERGYVFGRVAMITALLPYRVRISSGIESSYKKGDNGQPELMERNPDGTMEVHSVAGWDSSNQSWFAGNTFTADQKGYLSPKYQWTWSGGTPKGLAAYDVAQDRNEIQMGRGSKIPSASSGDVDLGGSEDGLGFPKTSIVTVDVSEKTTSMALDLEKDTYTVNWHLPQEWQGSHYKTDPPFWDSVEATTILLNSANAAGSVMGRWRWRNYYVGAMLNRDEGDVFGIAENAAPNPLTMLFFRACGIYGQQFSEEDQSDQNGNFQTIWDDEEFNSNPSTSASWANGRPSLPDGTWDKSNTTKAGYLLTNPRMLKKYQTSYWRGDAYGSQGYEGIIRRPVKKRIPGTWVTGDFIVDNGSGSGGD